ncbi:hypothetical protein [Pseudoclavibacter helvolus]|uniref:hypothetical protein n=1 Tax=Pseudoclavibacter helvolus TaxID=255205 RepID=UPI003C75A958
MKRKISKAYKRLSGQIELDKLKPGAVVLDDFGHAWQSALRHGPVGNAYPTGYWYRAYDGDDASETSTHDLSWRGPFTLIWEGK